MRYCPKCGSPLPDELDRCLGCDWKATKGKKRNLCPECGELLVKGVCYRCGYRSKHSHNTCPHCRQKLVAGRCEKCQYTKPLISLKRFFFGILIVLVLCLLLTKFL